MSKAAVRLALFLMPLVLFISAPATAIDMTLASRQIYTGNSFPAALTETGMFEKRQHILQSLNRFSFRADTGRQVLRFEYELSTSLFSSSSNTGSSNWATDNAISPIKKFKTGNSFLDTSRTITNGQIERLDLTFNTGRYDIQIGRQPISLGTGHYVSINDILAPFHPGYLDGSFKPGIDALRVRARTGNSGEMELIFAAMPASRDNSIIARFRDTYDGFDFESTLGRFRQRNFAAIGCEGEKKRYNLWGELALFERLDHEPCFGGFSGQIASSWLIGAERSTGHGWRHGLTMMHQDFGAREVSQISEAAATLPFRQGWAFLSGSDYLIINSRREMNPLTSLNLNLVHSLVHKSNLIQPVISISTSNESDLSLFGWFNTGQKPETNSAATRQNSEFGSFANGVGLLYRRYFGN